MPGTRKLGRASDHRKAMLRGLVTYLFENGKIETTVTRAKEVRSMAEKMITIAKDSSLHSKRMVLAYVTKEEVTKKLFDEIAPKYRDINGGYCRLIKTAPRRGDAAEMCIIELIDPQESEKKAKKNTKKSDSKKSDSKKETSKKETEKKPAAKKAPAKKAPVVEEAAPVEEAPVVEEVAPVEEAPVVEETAPVEEAPVAEEAAPVEEAPAEESEEKSE